MSYVLIGGVALGAVGGGLGAWGASRAAKSGNQRVADAMNKYPYSPYSGYKPQRIDTASKEILRPTQAQDFDITMRRSLGQDVGYDPSWMSESQKVLQSNFGRSLKDQLRNSAGSLSASGLSGNPRAYEATSGRIQRDTDENLQNALSGLTIANMEASREDKNSATNRLAELNRFNFGQENTVADFDLNQWQMEESAKQGRMGLGLNAASMYRNPSAQALSVGGSALSSMGSGLLGAYGAGSGTSAVRQPGTGISPSSGALSSKNFSSYNQNPALSRYRNYTF